jgi:hypothetical protein
VVADVPVRAAADYRAGSVHDERADRDLVVHVACVLGEGERLAHEGLVGGGLPYSHSIVAGGLPLMS